MARAGCSSRSTLSFIISAVVFYSLFILPLQILLYAEFRHHLLGILGMVIPGPACFYGAYLMLRKPKSERRTSEDQNNTKKL
jgi:hypothetical protein